MLLGECLRLYVLLVFGADYILVRLHGEVEEDDDMLKLMVCDRLPYIFTCQECKRTALIIACAE